MAGWKKHNPWVGPGIKPGEVSETGDTKDTYLMDETTQAYPGYMPQRYVAPKMGPQKENAGEVGDGTVPNNTDRGNYGHGVIVDSEVWDKDHTRKDKSDLVPQVMPEEEDQREYDPIKVTIVDKSPDEIIKMYVDTYTWNGVPTNTAQGSNTQAGNSLVRILYKDPRRKRAIIAVSNMQAGSVPKIYPSSGNAHGFPIPAATAVPLELTTTEEVWAAGATTADSFTISVLTERCVNSDPYLPDGKA
jgi:hypothetical protein